MFKRLLFSLLLLLVLGILFYFFINEAHYESVDNDEVIRIALATNTIKSRDYFNISAQQALEKLSQKYKFEFVHIANESNYDWVYNIEEVHAQKKLDLVIGVGWQAGEIFPVLHSKNEEIKLIAIDSMLDFGDLKSVQFSRAEGAYIIGAMMATAFPDDLIFGFIGNHETVYGLTYLDGFTKGLQSINPEIRVLASFTKSYENASRAYELAKEQGSLGINFTLTSLSPVANMGIYAYAREREQTDKLFYTSCMEIDETSKERPFILTGIVKNMDLALQVLIEDFLKNGYTAERLNFGISNNGIDVICANTLHVNYRNEKIITDEVIKAGKLATRYVINQNFK